jgi:hypothetical protein
MISALLEPTMIRNTLFASVGVVVLWCGAAGQPAENSADVVPIKYDGLKQEVLKHRGKVLVVDFWSSG